MVSHYPNSFISYLFTASQIYKSQLPMEASITVKIDVNMPWNSSSSFRKFIFPTMAYITSKTQQITKKLLKSCDIFPKILIRGPIVSEYCNIIANLEMRQPTDMEKRYQNLYSIFSSKLARIRYLYSSLLRFSSVYRSF